jgi:hypothetical protein
LEAIRFFPITTTSCFTKNPHPAKFNNAKERNNILFIVSLSVTGYKRRPLECGCPPESFQKYFSDGILQYCLKSLICQQFSYWNIPATIFQESPVPLKSNLKDEGQF